MVDVDGNRCEALRQLWCDVSDYCGQLQVGGDTGWQTRIGASSSCRERTARQR